MGRGGKRTNAGRKSKMELNNFDEFEVELLLNLVNHHDGDSIDQMPLYIITWAGKLSISLDELRKKYGIKARERLERWFDIDVGRSGENSRARLRTDVMDNLLLWFEWKGVYNRLRRDPDGILDSWVVTAENVVSRRLNPILELEERFK